MAKEIPVYLFVGFLESGKTKFIQETFEDPNISRHELTTTMHHLSLLSPKGT